MLKRLTLYPFLFVLFVILNLLVANLDEIDPALAARPAAAVLLAAAGAVLLLRAVFKDWHYAGYLAFLVLFLFFSYGHLRAALAVRLPEEYRQEYPFALLGVQGAVMVGLGLRRTWRRLGGAKVTPFLNLIGAFLLVSQTGFGTVQLVRRAVIAGHPPGVTPVTAASEPEITLDCSRSPDIYWIILDSYGRADVLEELYGADTRDFLAELEALGFYVAGESHANYIQTVYSIPSALNFSYLPPKPANQNGYTYFPELVASNRLTALLKQCGYRTVAFESGFRFTNYPSADVYLQYGADQNEFEELLLADTPLDLLPERPQTGQLPPRSYGAHRARVNFAFDRLAELPEMNGPQFVYAHIITPHPPFVFDAQGGPLQPRRGYSLVDGSDFKGSWAEYRRGYAGQVQNANRLVAETVRAILARSAVPPVIIIQGDHGPGSRLKWGDPDASCLWERTPILLAYYLPDGGQQQLYPQISPVNSFRVVLNAYFGLDLPLLPDETYFTSPKAGGPFIDVTGRRESRENCD